MKPPPTEHGESLVKPGQLAAPKQKLDRSFEGDATADSTGRPNAAPTRSSDVSPSHTAAERACAEVVKFCAQTFQRDAVGVHCYPPSSRKVTSLQPLACLDKVAEFTVTGITKPIDVRDLSPLAHVRGLRVLDLRHTRVADIHVLAGLTQLESLSLAETRVLDLSSLASLPKLRKLELFGTEIQDIAALSKLTTLAELNLGVTKVDDVTALAALPLLKSLWLWETPLEDIQPLGNVASLEQLFLSDTKVRDLSPLSNLTNLRYLDLSGAPIDDLSALHGLSRLKELRIRRTKTTWKQVAEIMRAIPGLRVYKG